MLPTFVQQVIGVVVRAAILWIAAWVAAHGGPTFTESQVAKIVAEATPVVLVVLWSILQKYKSHQRFQIAAAAGRPVSENHVEMMLSSGQAPSVLTEPHVIPILATPSASAIVTK